MNLVPKHWNITVRTVKDLLFLGKATVSEIVRSWLYTANGLASEIEDRKEKLKFLQTKSAVDIRKIAEQYEDPEFGKISLPKDNQSDGPEPLDRDSINRNPGRTTFNVCGWCKYATGGTARHNYIITTSCNIKTSAGLIDEERHFNTPCFLKEAPYIVFDEIRNGLASEQRRLIEEKRRADKKVKLLVTLERSAEKKPAMSGHRPSGWFNVNDPVVCYTGQGNKNIARAQGEFVTAKVILGYRHHDGCVSVYYDKRIHTGKYLDGHGASYGTSRPEIMHAWEYEYLTEHPDFARIWIRDGVSKYIERFNAEKFLTALVKKITEKEK